MIREVTLISCCIMLKMDVRLKFAQKSHILMSRGMSNKAHFTHKNTYSTHYSPTQNS
jgi:hypothetical protein